LVLTTRDFGGDSYLGVSIYLLEKAPLIAGSELVGTKFELDREEFGQVIGDGLHMLAADVDGNDPPPPGSPIPIISTQDDDQFGTETFDAINVFEITVDWTAQFAFLVVAVQLPTSPFDSNDQSGGRESISQPGTEQKLDSLSFFALHRLAYRKFASYESMVVVRSAVERAGDGSPLGVRWFEIRRDIDTGTYVIHQEGTFSPNDGINRWMGSIAQDSLGNIAMGYSVVGVGTNTGDVFPGIRYAGRLAGDALGKMSLGEQTLIDGSGYQTGFVSRWGDYSSMNIDPTDDCTFWYTNEYYADDGSGPDRGRKWQTRIGSFALPGCDSFTPPPPPGECIIGTCPDIEPLEQQIADLEAAVLALDFQCNNVCNIQLPEVSCPDLECPDNTALEAQVAALEATIKALLEELTTTGKGKGRRLMSRH